MPAIFGGKPAVVEAPAIDPLPPVDKFEDGAKDRQAVMQAAAKTLQPIADALAKAYGEDVAGHYKDAGRGIDLVKADVDRLASSISALAATYRNR